MSKENFVEYCNYAHPDYSGINIDIDEDEDEDEYDWLD